MHITMTDITRAGYCARGTKTWFGRKDLDFRAFLKDGISAERLLATGDAMAEHVVEAKLARQKLERDRGR